MGEKKPEVGFDPCPRFTGSPARPQQGKRVVHPDNLNSWEGEAPAESRLVAARRLRVKISVVPFQQRVGDCTYGSPGASPSRMLQQMAGGFGFRYSWHPPKIGCHSISTEKSLSPDTVISGEFGLAVIQLLVSVSLNGFHDKYPRHLGVLS